MGRRIVTAGILAVSLAWALAGRGVAAVNAAVTEVRVASSTLLPGTPPAGADGRAGSRAARSPKKKCPSAPRGTVDRPDALNGYQLHVVYLLPSNMKDKRLDADGTLACSILSINEWMEKTAGIMWRLDTVAVGPGRGLPDITFVPSKKRADQLADVGSIGEELARLGFGQRQKRYVVFVESDAGGVCGEALVPLSVTAEPVDGKYAATFLKSNAGCGTRDFGWPGSPGRSEAVTLQEVLHNDGLVQATAPHTCHLDLGLGISHVCTGPLGFATAAEIADLDPEAVDVMFPFIMGQTLGEKVLDRGNDDYFRHGVPIRLDLVNSPYIISD